MADLVGNPDIILILPRLHEAVNLRPVDGYVAASLPSERDAWWIDIHRQAVPSFDRADLSAWLKRYRQLALPDGILVASDSATGTPVATAGCIVHTKNEMFPDGGQLAWVATIPEHRGCGLATWLSALATLRLQREGFERIFVCTGDDMPWAIHVYPVSYTHLTLPTN